MSPDWMSQCSPRSFDKFKDKTLDASSIGTFGCVIRQPDQYLETLVKKNYIWVNRSTVFYSVCLQYIITVGAGLMGTIAETWVPECEQVPICEMNLSTNGQNLVRDGCLIKSRCLKAVGA